MNFHFLFRIRILSLCQSHKPQDSLTSCHLSRVMSTAPSISLILECKSDHRPGKTCVKALDRLGSLDLFLDAV